MKKNLIIPRFFGGIGNQLFIYAAARRLAIMNNAELILDDRSGFARDHEYQRHFQLDHFNIKCRKATPTERLEPFAYLRRYIMRKVNQHFPFKNNSYVVQRTVDFDPWILTFVTKGTVYLEGYWQSENYFKDCEKQIREDLIIKPPTDCLNQSIVQKITSSNAVAVHIRFFEPPSVDEGGVPVINDLATYYKRAINFIEQKTINAHFYLFSDNPEAARIIVPLPKSRVTIVDHNNGDEMAFADLWLMSKCKHFVIANSTFSWWGAWLCDNQEKIVIAPGFKKYDGNAYWGFKGLLPEDWTKL